MFEAYKPIRLTDSRTVIFSARVPTRCGRITMGHSSVRTRSKPPTCDLCSETLETAATAQNPSAKLQPYTLARCPKCLILCILDETLRPCRNEVLDEDTFNVAMNSSPEMRTWVEQTLATHRLRNAAERIAECSIAREWVVTRGGSHVAGDLATLGRYARSFDPKTGYNTAPVAMRHRAAWLLDQSRRNA
jgi:hypothetical protein